MTKDAIKKQIRQAFDRRVAVRVYKDEEIPREDMEAILDTAWLSPSSIGLEGWRFVVLDRQHIKGLAPELKEVAWGAQYQLDTASHFVLLLAEKADRYDSQPIRESLIRRGITVPADLEARLARYKIFQEENLKLADNPRALFDWTAKQTYIALANMMTSAALMGIDSCPIEGFDYDQINAILAKHQIIKPDKEGIASMASFGYRLRDPKHPRSRKPREDVITWLD